MQKPNINQQLLKLSVFLTGVALSIVPLNPAIAQQVVRIAFARNSYCGVYSGNFSGGREFVLNLRRGQTLTSTNTGSGTQTEYVTGPVGKVRGVKVASDQINYEIPANGDYYIYVESTSRYSSIEFCAY
jgi:hypothetical protein